MEDVGKADTEGMDVAADTDVVEGMAGNAACVGGISEISA